MPLKKSGVRHYLKCGGNDCRKALAVTRACLKIHSRQMRAPLRGIFEPNSGYIARYAPFIWLKSPTNCDAHLSESNFQTRSQHETMIESFGLFL